MKRNVRVVAGWIAAARLAPVLFRQGRWNARILQRCQTQLRIAGVPVSQIPPGTIRTPLRHYGRLLRSIPKLAEDDAAYWREQIHQLHDEVVAAASRHPGSRKSLNDPDARQLQESLLRRFFQERLRLDLSRSADAFTRYRHGSEALRDFFDFCESDGRLTSREEIERAVGDFAGMVQRYRVTNRGDNPAPGYFRRARSGSRVFWSGLAPFLLPGRLLAQIYWGKEHRRRVVGDGEMPPWAVSLLAERLNPPKEMIRHLPRSMLVFETYLLSVRMLVRVCGRLASAPESPKTTGILREAMDDLARGVRAFAAGWRAPG